jgi:hypothetical protein
MRAEDRRLCNDVVREGAISCNSLLREGAILSRSSRREGMRAEDMVSTRDVDVLIWAFRLKTASLRTFISSIFHQKREKGGMPLIS